MGYYDHERTDRDEQWRDRAESVVRKPYCDRLPPKNRELWGDFSDYLFSRGLRSHTAKANLWYPSCHAGDAYPRIVMPAASDQEGNHFWQARLMDHAGMQLTNNEKQERPRYESPHGCRSGDAVIIVYPFGLTHEAQTGHPEWNESVVVEGPMCALAVAGTGRLGIATMGADPPEERLDLIFKRIRGTICTIVPDSDRQDLFIHVFTYLSNRGIQCRWLVPGPSAKDFADMTIEARHVFFN